MKKVFLTTAAALVFALSSLSSMAQIFEEPNNIISVRAGVTVTNVGYRDAYLIGSTLSKAGFQIEVVDQIRLLNTIPLYLETGIFAVEKGMTTNLPGIKSFNSYYYVGVPLMINYRWSVGSKFVIEPQLGFFYAFLAGASINGTESVTNFDSTNRSDFGLRVAAGATYNNLLSLRIGYDAGFLSMSKPISGVQMPTVTNGSLFITFGVNFVMSK